MKIIHISDLHLSLQQPIARLDNAVEAQFAKLDYVLSYADKAGACVIIAGDVFDKPRSWYLLPKVIRLLRQYSGVPILAVFGQHDTYLYSATTRDATSLGCLAEAGLVTILDNNLGNYFDLGEAGFWHLLGANYGQVIPEPIEGDFNILVIHAPIAEKALFPNHEYLDASNFLDEHKFDLILCGDIHRRFRIVNQADNRAILNPGPLFRGTADEYNMSLKPGFFEIIVSSDDGVPVINFVEVPHKPAKDVLTREHLDKAQHNIDMLSGFIGSLVNRDMFGKVGTDLVENIWKFVKENDLGQEVVDLLSQLMGGKDG